MVWPVILKGLCTTVRGENVSAQRAYFFHCKYYQLFLVKIYPITQKYSRNYMKIPQNDKLIDV